MIKVSVVLVFWTLV